MNSVNSEVSLVHGKYFANTFSLGNPDKRCVGKIHRAIGSRSSRMRGKSTKASGSSSSAFLTNISHKASWAAGRSFNRYIASVNGGHTVAKGSCTLFRVGTHCSWY